MMASVESSRTSSCATGLSHLVEAATALTALVDSQKKNSAKRTGSKPVVSDDDESRTQKAHSKTGKKREIFPQKLMEILADSSLSDVVSWLPHGRSFVIIRPDIFTEQVLPKYLPSVDSRASTKYPSFTRKLNRWGFRQATRGPDTGAFHHPLFRRDQPELCLNMVCQKSRERQVSSRRVLPPKKRSISEKSSTGQGQVDVLESNPPNVSSDDRSVSSFAASTASSSQNGDICLPHPPVTHVAGEKDNSFTLPFISNDRDFVSRTLRERDANERLKASRAMLYDAYVKALNGGMP